VRLNPQIRALKINSKNQTAKSMHDEKHLTIHFNNGTKMSVSFPTQIKHSMAALVEASKRILEADKLVIQTDKEILIIPWSSVKYLAAGAVPGAALPFGAIKGARFVESSEKSQATGKP
jgi:hypothetical protein